MEAIKYVRGAENPPLPVYDYFADCCIGYVVSLKGIEFIDIAADAVVGPDPHVSVAVLCQGFDKVVGNRVRGARRDIRGQVIPVVFAQAVAATGPYLVL